MARRPFTDTGFRCGRYPVAWNPARVVTFRAASFRFEVRGEGAGRAVVENVATAAEALQIARRLSSVLLIVYVRDRTKRRGYLSEKELEVLAALEVADKANDA